MKTYGSYKDVEAVYKDDKFFGSLVRHAGSRLFRSDMAVDAVHDALVKTLENQAKHRAKGNKDKRISAYILRREVDRACRRINKAWGMIPVQEYDT